MSENGEIILYQTEDGTTNVEVHLSDDTVWLNQAQMADLFQTTKQNVSLHINNIFKSGELERNSTVKDFLTVQEEGKRKVNRKVEYYNLDVIISVGYRVNTHRGVQFRIWATQTLREYVVKGFVIDDERLSGKQPNYFDELIERVRRIRTSEANFYEKVKAIFSTSIDYDLNTDPARLFYKTVQNKFHFAITGQTAAELIVSRVNAFKPDMGLVHKKGKRVTKQEAEIAKNYLQELELKRLELLVEQFLSFAELQSLEQRPMYMRDWLVKLDEFIRLNDKQVLTNAGTVSRRHMKQIVNEEFEAYARKLLANGEISRDEFNRVLKHASRPTELPEPDEDMD